MATTDTRRSKYGAVRTAYNGVIYDSILEAEVAKVLDVLRTTPDPRCRVYQVWRQVIYPLSPSRPGQRGVTWRADFVVLFGPTQGSLRFVVLEVKGHETPAWKVKRAWIEQMYPTIPLHIVRSTRDVLTVAEEGGGHVR